ncbi:hypothetical protein AVEN_59101-1 [Araneus ventricosus]|uniref:Uncharacterized protein n=1 Tax=Araneus ventricosus TaxID=182803 RepID=A0A4Y2NTD8_ARAVE|nr:hypothetical protein AVEN_59101-1 [Araneus ventricosus]
MVNSRPWANSKKTTSPRLHSDAIFALMKFSWRPGALSRFYRQLFAPNSSRSRVLKYSEKIVVTFNLDLSPTPSETNGSNFSPFPRVREVETIDQSKESTLSDFEA